MHQQYKDNLDETQDEKLALRVALEDVRVVTANLQHLIESKEATIAQLNSRLTATAGGKTLEETIAELRERLATAEAVGRASNEAWAKEHQQLQDEVARVKRDKLRARTSLGAANQTIDRAREEDEEYKSGCFESHGILRIPGEVERRRTRPAPSNAYPAPSNAPVRGQPERRASAGEQRGLVSDVPLTRRSGATLHRGSRDVQADDSGTAMTAIAQSP